MRTEGGESVLHPESLPSESSRDARSGFGGEVPEPPLAVRTVLSGVSKGASPGVFGDSAEGAGEVRGCEPEGRAGRGACG